MNVERGNVPEFNRPPQEARLELPNPVKVKDTDIVTALEALMDLRDEELAELKEQTQLLHRMFAILDQVAGVYLGHQERVRR